MGAGSLSDNGSPRSVLRKIIVTSVLGAVSFPFTQLLFDTLTGQIVTAVAFGAMVLLIQILADFENRLARVEAQLVASVAEVRAIVEEGFSKVNGATELLARVEGAGLKTVAVTNLMENAAGISPKAAPLVCSLAQIEIDRVSTFLKDLVSQEVTYDGEDHDWLLGLTRCAEHTIDAVSLPEVDSPGETSSVFWDSPLGRHYLDLQRDAIRRGVVIRRVFVIGYDRQDGDANLDRVCRLHSELGIKVRLLYPAAVPRVVRDSMYDFIVFDRTISYEVATATHVERGETPRIMSCRLILRDIRLAERIERYENLWAAAVPWVDSESIDVVPISRPLVSRESGN
jgi:hypothetical protein